MEHALEGDVGLLFDLDKGTLSVYKNSRRLDNEGWTVWRTLLVTEHSRGYQLDCCADQKMSHSRRMKIQETKRIGYKSIKISLQK
jgi:hypothetical protein